MASPSAGKEFPRSLPDAVVCSWLGTKALMQDSTMWKEDCKASYWSLRMMPSFWSELVVLKVLLAFIECCE